MRGKIQAIEQKTKTGGTPFRRVKIAGQWASFWETTPLAVGQDIEFNIVMRGKFADLKLAGANTEPAANVTKINTEFLMSQLGAAGVAIDEVDAVVEDLHGLVTRDAALLIVAKKHGIDITPPADPVEEEKFERTTTIGQIIRVTVGVPVVEEYKLGQNGVLSISLTESYNHVLIDYSSEQVDLYPSLPLRVYREVVRD